MTGDQQSQPPAGVQPEVVSLLGARYYADRYEGPELAEQESLLSQLRAAYQADPGDLTKLLAYGRQLATMWRYNDAIALYTQGMTTHPTAWELYRFRGHRHISTRQFALGERDLVRARQLGGDNFDILYHLGLARWLLGDFEGAVEPYQACYAVTGAAEHQVAIVYWLYLTLLRTGRDAEAAALLAKPYSPDVGENIHYHKLLQVFGGHFAEADLIAERPVGAEAGDAWDGTIGFGLAAWHLINGRTERAVELLRRILASRHWSAFGFIAAEAEMARMGK